MLGLVPISAAPISALAGQSGPIFLAPVAQGGIQSAGAAVTKRRTTYKPTGGFVASGAALGGLNPMGVKVAPSPTGGIAAAGVAQVDRWFRYVPTTGGLVSGGYARACKTTSILFISKGAFASGIAALTVAAPASGQAGDLELLFVESANEAIALPAGFTQVTNSPQFTGTAAAAGGVRLAVFHRWWVDNTSTVSVTDTGNHQTAIRMYFRGVDATTPFDATPVGSVQASAATAWTLPAITTASYDCMIVLAVATDYDAATTAALASWTNASLSQITEQHDQTIASGVGGGLGIATGLYQPIGGTGTTAVTSAASVTGAFLTIALRHKPDPMGVVQPSSTGGITAAGQAAASRSFCIGTCVPTGGIAAAGYSFTERMHTSGDCVPAGGITTSGYAGCQAILQTGSIFNAPAPTGGLVTAGQSGYEKNWWYASGGITLSGTSDAYLLHIVGDCTATGGVVISGTAVVNRVWVATVVGGWSVGGTAPTAIAHTVGAYVGVGGLLTPGVGGFNSSRHGLIPIGYVVKGWWPPVSGSTYFGGIAAAGSGFAGARPWNNITGTGGLAGGGTVRYPGLWPRRYLPTGGLLSSGSGSGCRVKSYHPTGLASLHTAGAASCNQLHRHTFTPSNTGAVLRSGQTQYELRRNLRGAYIPSGGLYAGGTSDMRMPTRAYFPSGGIIAGGGSAGFVRGWQSLCAISLTGRAGYGLIRPLTRADSPGGTSPFSPYSSLFAQLNKIYTTTGNVERLLV